MAHTRNALLKFALFVKDLSKGLLLSAGVAAVIAYFSTAKFASTTFFIWAALFINGAIATWEDAMPGGFDNLNGEVPEDLRGAGRWKFLASTLLFVAGFSAIGIYLFQLGY